MTLTRRGLFAALAGVLAGAVVRPARARSAFGELRRDGLWFMDRASAVPVTIPAQGEFDVLAEGALRTPFSTRALADPGEVNLGEWIAFDHQGERAYGHVVGVNITDTANIANGLRGSPVEVEAVTASGQWLGRMPAPLNFVASQHRIPARSARSRAPSRGTPSRDPGVRACG